MIYREMQVRGRAEDRLLLAATIAYKVEIDDGTMGKAELQTRAGNSS